MALLLAGGLLLLLLELSGLESWSVMSPWPTFYRMGQALLALGVLSALPVFRIPGLVSLGRSSLGVYVAHLVLLYGWAGDEGLFAQWAHRLAFPEALGLAVTVLIAATAMAQGVPTALRWLGENAAPRWRQPSGELGSPDRDARHPARLEPGPHSRPLVALEHQGLAFERAPAPERLLHRLQPLGALARSEGELVDHGGLLATSTLALVAHDCPGRTLGRRGALGLAALVLGQTVTQRGEPGEGRVEGTGLRVRRRALLALHWGAAACRAGGSAEVSTGAVGSPPAIVIA
jgi:hypothetical protein